MADARTAQETTQHPLPAHVDVEETPVGYRIELDVADFTAGELSVETLGAVVTVRGERPAPAEGEPAFRLHERLEESFRLPDDADASSVGAVFRHGVLELRVPKLASTRRTVPVEPVRAHLVDPEATPC